MLRTGGKLVPSGLQQRLYNPAHTAGTSDLAMTCTQLATGPDAKKDFTVPAQENALLATVMVMQTDALMDLESVWCAPGYYGNPLLIGSTCKKCDCSGNSDPNLIFEDCDEVTGQCRNCLRNTTGFKCERCAPGYYGDARFAKNCTGCDKCIWDLTDDIRLAVLAIDESKSTLLSISTGVAAQKRLNDLNLTTTHLQAAMSKKKNHAVLWTIEVDDTADEMNDLLREAATLDEQGNEASSKGLLIQKETMETNNRATQLVQQLSNMRDNIQEISSKMKYYAIQQELSPEEIAQKLSEAEEMLKEIKRRKPFTDQRQLADKEENKAEELLQQVEEFHEKYNDTRSLVSDVLEQLSEQDMKLSDLEEALDEALDYVMQMEDINKENTANLQRREKQHEKIKEQTDELNGILLSATTILAGPQKVSSELSEVIKNVSGFYAEIDGAKKELQEKIANLSLFDDDLVEKAMHHAHNLRRLADELDRNLYGVDTNGLVQRAINASNAYENIASYIEEANKAALLALNTTNRVNDAAVGIDTQTIYHKVEARKRLEQAKLKTAEVMSATMTVSQATTPMHENAKNYIGLAIKNDNLVYIYNLGDQDMEIPLDAKPVSTWPSYFSIIKIERIGRHGKMFLTVPSLSSTAEEKFIKKGEVLGPGSLLNLEPENAVFYVGGVPPDFKLPPSLNLPGFIGCLELATLNDDVISLYNFKHVYNIDTTTSPPCARNKLAFTQSRAVSYFFDGSGYALARNIERRGRFSQVTRFDIEVRTPTDNGLILLMINGSMFFSLEMHNGFLHLRYDFGFSTGPVLLEDSMRKAQINDAKFHEISIIYHNSKKMILVVDRRHIKSVDNERTAMPFTDIYIGGAPAEILHSSISSHLAGNIGFKGCMKGFQFQKKDFNLLEEPGTLGISYGCPEDSLMSRKAYFNGESFIASSQKVSLFSEFEGGFNFRTLQPNGLLFYYSEGSDVLSISMDRGAVVLNASGTKIQSPDRNYNDGKTHFIITSVTPERYELTVDDKKQSKKNPAKDRAGKSPDSIKKFYFGGSPLRTQQANFTGCISNAYFTRLDREVEVEDFQQYSEKVQTSLYGCPVESPPVALLHKKGKNSSKAKGNRNKKLKFLVNGYLSVKVGRDKDKISQPSNGLKKLYQEANIQRDPQCHLPMNPKATEHAYQFGGTANSRQEFDHIPKDFSERAQFSISLKTHSSHGMIFYISDQKETNFMALFVAHGRLIFMFNAGHQKIRIKSQEKYNDGLWHNVIFIRGKNIGRLIIDGLRVLEEPFNGNANTWQVTEPLYIGGVAPGKAVKNIQINSVYSFSGCLSNLQLNGRSITSASQTFSVTPCFEGPSEAGTYFSSEGGYVILDESFSLGLKFEVVFEIRPRSSSGILLHGHSVNGEYLNMHMRNGQVTVKLNNGIRDFSTSVTLKQSLCDGRWHRIAVIRDANVVQLDVDSEVNHVVGPLNPKATDHREPVFIGGVPESLLTSSLTTRNSFIGCIRNFMIDEKPVSFSKAALVSGAVSINTCPAA
ncbi:laminin subunit alpha-4 [Grus japonensis]|uniref:Laminin subunit alpha-4 n=1 Tax=Grus japonensis TaxID=30415 RepID=A0ABC9WN34_GRUJA